MEAPGDDFALPTHRYVPGRTARHPEAAFAPMRAEALAQTRSETAAANGAWRFGLRLFDTGFWWEAHEVLEPVWLNAAPNSAERAMTQAVIQLANAALKQEMGRPSAAARLFAIARGHAAEAALNGEASAMGIDFALFGRALTAIEHGKSPPPLS